MSWVGKGIPQSQLRVAGGGGGGLGGICEGPQRGPCRGAAWSPHQGTRATTEGVAQ